MLVLHTQNLGAPTPVCQIRSASQGCVAPTRIHSPVLQPQKGAT